MKLNKFTYYYFLAFFSFLPVSIILGSSIFLINVLALDISFLILLIYMKNFSFIKTQAFKYLSVLYVYLIFNSFISIDTELGIYRNIGFLRIIILFVAFNYFFNVNFFFKKVFFIWFIFLTFIVVDVFLESFSGTNLIGYGGIYGKRIVSFFRDEPIVGWYISSFYFLIAGYLLDYFGEKNKYKILFFMIIFFTAIILTGERSSTIKSFLGILLFFFFFKEFKLNQKILFISAFFIFLTVIFFNSDYLKHRFFKQTFLTTYDKSILVNLKNSLYLKHYASGLEVFKNNKILGVGNKNYRSETCKDKDQLSSTQKRKYLCSTHRHQIYFELLSEHGLFGTLLILIIFYKLVISKVIKNFNEENYLYKASLVHLFLFFLPLIPSGSFFSDYSITILAINLSIFYGSSKRLNIFQNVEK